MHQRGRSAKFDRGSVIVERFSDARPSAYRPLFKDVFLHVLHLIHLVFGQNLHFVRLFPFGCFNSLFFELFHIYFNQRKLFVSFVSFFGAASFEHDFDFSHLLKLYLSAFFNNGFELLLVLILYFLLVLLVLLPHLVDFLLDVFFVILQIFLVEDVGGVRLGVVESPSFPGVHVHSG